MERITFIWQVLIQIAEIEKEYIQESNAIYGEEELKKLSSDDLKLRTAALHFFLSTRLGGATEIIELLKNNSEFRGELEKLAEGAPEESLLKECIDEAL